IAMLPLLFADSLFDNPVALTGVWIIAGILGLLLLLELFGLRYIPNDRVGVVEKLWSPKGSIAEGRIIALSGEAGFQSDVLRGGFHFGLWRWQYRIHKLPLVTIPQGQIGYVYARDGEPLAASQTLGRVVDCNNFQDARSFLASESVSEASPTGQRGRQRAIFREGVYAINLALYVVITENQVYRLSLQGRAELETILSWQQELRALDGFHPVVIGKPMEAPDPIRPEQNIQVDSIGIVTVHDG